MGGTSRGSADQPIYGLGLIGAAVWYWQQADGFWGHVWGLVEAVLWPAFVVYDLLDHLG
jgi:hypothetical protein